MKNYLTRFLGLILLCALPCQASVQPDAQQNHADIINAVNKFVREQTLTYPGQVSIKIEAIDRRVVRPACQALEVFLPAGSQLLGNSMVGVRCPGIKEWTVFVPVHVRLSVDMLMTSKPLVQGHVIGAEDIATQKGELSQMSTLTDPTQAVGKILKMSVGAGQLLKQEMLRSPYAVSQGQTVQLKVQGASFSVLAEGVALANANDGQPVKIKVKSGQVINGKAQSGGIVEIAP